MTIAAQLFEVTAADVAGTSDDRYTPPWIFKAADLVFDLDVAAPIDPMRRTCPARCYLTVIEDGLAQPWDGLVWMNPPFSRPVPWTERFVTHGNGLAIVPTPRQETYYFGRMMRAADAVAFISTDFIRPDGSVNAVPCLIMLVGIGSVAAGGVSRVAAADKFLQGAYHVRPHG